MDHGLSSVVVAGREHVRYKIDIAILSGNRIAEKLSLLALATYLSGRKSETRREACSGLAIKLDLVGKLSEVQSINDRIQSLRLLCLAIGKPSSSAYVDQRR